MTAIIIMSHTLKFTHWLHNTMQSQKQAKIMKLNLPHPSID